jgi:hypothetical protein
MKKAKSLSALVILAALVMFLFTYLSATVNTLAPGAPGFTPVRDDEAARRFAPALVSNDAFGFPLTCLYRAARDGAGNLHIAYHPVWEYERNDTGGLMPFLSRTIYTGGLRIQRIMFGKGDVEVIAVTVDPRGVITSVEYERPKNYDPSGFGVEHEQVSLKGPLAQVPVFRVASWNHLFERAEGASISPQGGERAWKCAPGYFTDELWQEYTMVRIEETRMKKSRAHFDWERDSAK